MEKIDSMEEEEAKLKWPELALKQLAN
jgi:hypothetical protein